MLNQSFDLVLIYFSEVPAQKPAPTLMQEHKNRFPAAHTNTRLAWMVTEQVIKNQLF